jgi:hypothetical protein
MGCGHRQPITTLILRMPGIHLLLEPRIELLASQPDELPSEPVKDLAGRVVFTGLEPAGSRYWFKASNPTVLPCIATGLISSPPCRVFFGSRAFFQETACQNASSISPHTVFQKRVVSFPLSIGKDISKILAGACQKAGSFSHLLNRGTRCARLAPIESRRMLRPMVPVSSCGLVND